MPTPVSTRTESTFVRDRVAALGLAPHPEGGWFREVYRSSATLGLPRGTRSLLTLIDYVLGPGSFSAWHVVRSDEVWSWHAGDVIELHTLDDAGVHRVQRLGPGLVDGERAAVVVPAGLWQAARCVGAVGVHVTCAVAPGFDFADFRMAERTTLLARHPEHADIIATLTRV